MDETKNITTSNCILKSHKRPPQMTDCFKHFKKKFLKVFILDTGLKF